jgi:GH25 family lysozyme M1 (1,4-beta-N-acetylmuramidase)
MLTSAPAWAQRPLGIDVYSGSGSINWTNVKNAGITFAWTKGTQSTNYEDTPMGANIVNGKAVGIYMGAYDFAIPGSNTPAAEARYFWNYAGSYIKNDGKSFMPMLDFETFDGYTGATSYADWVNQWCNDIKTNAAAHGVSVTPVVYISACNACDLNTSVTNWGAWIASYNDESYTSGNPWSACTSCEVWGSGAWQLWQFTSSAVVPGVPGNASGYCDEDTFNGTAAGVISDFLVGLVTNPPVSITVNLGSSATFTVGAIGGSTAKYQWLFDQTNIPNATASTYVITNAQLTNAGAYSVVVSNSVGGSLTPPAFLSVIAPLTNATGSILAPTNMVNWWTADGNINDIYGTNNLTPYSGIYYTKGEECLAFHLDGSTGYLLPVGGATNIPPNWTLCLWVNRQNAPGTSASLMGDTTYALKLEQYNDTREIGLTHSGVADYYFKISVPQNIWTHLALVDSGSQILLYTNGVFASSTLYSNNVAIVTPSGFPLPRACIGADELANGNQTDFLLGGLDEIQTYHRALSAGQIAAIYAAGSAGLVRAPQFTGVTVNGNNQVQLNLEGLTGKNFTLYDSTDLISWGSLGAVANPTGAVQYLDSTVLPYKFYRATQPQP